MSLHQPSNALSEFDYGKIQNNSNDVSSLGDLVSLSGGSDSFSDSKAGVGSEPGLNLVSISGDSALKQASMNSLGMDSDIGSFDFSDFDDGIEDFKTTDKTKESEKTLDTTEFKNDSFGAYTKALDEGKYTAILFGSEYCGFCKNMEKKLGDKALGKYADKMIASVTDGDKDKGARQLEEALGVVRYPTLVILKTNSKNINVAGRIEGEVPIKEIDRIFAEATKDDIKKQQDDRLDNHAVA